MTREKSLNCQFGKIGTLPTITIETDSISDRKVVDASITLKPTVLTPEQNIRFVIDFIDSDGNVIWSNVDTIFIGEDMGAFVLHISDELQHAIDYKMPMILRFTPEKSVQLGLEQVLEKNYYDAVFMSVNESMKNSAKHSVGLNSAGDLAVNLVTGNVALERQIIPLRSNALALSLKHIYTSYFDKVKENYGLHSNCGKNWKLNMEQYLIRENHQSGTELIYINEYGQEDRLVEKYYYLNSNNQKIYVDKNDITYDIGGSLKFDTNDVYTECKSSTGLKLVTDKKDIAGAEYVDLEPEELSQIRAQEESIISAIEQLEKTISQSEQQLCFSVISRDGIKDDGGNIIVAITKQNFIHTMKPIFELIVDNESNVILNGEEIDNKLSNAFNSLNISGGTFSGCTDSSTTNSWTIQINSHIDNLSTYYQQLKIYKIQHQKIAYQLKIYEEQTPQYYLYSDSVIYGFSKLEVEDKTESDNSDDGGTETVEVETETEIDRYTLTYISDYYGNTFILKYDTGTNTGYETGNEKELGKGTYNLLYIVDQNENIVSFNYNSKNLLESIIDAKENRYEFGYDSNDNFHTFYNNYNITARYIYDTSNNLIGAVDKNGMGCLLGYNSKKVETIKPISALDKIQIEHQESFFKTELNLINSSNIASCVIDQNNFIKIDYYDYKSTSIKAIKKVEDSEETQKTVTYIFDKYGNTKTTYINDFNEDNPDNNNADVQSFDYMSDKISFTSKPYPSAKNFLSGVCFGDSVIVDEAVNYIGDDLITGDCILCETAPVHTAYHNMNTSADAKDSVIVPDANLSEISQKISCLTLSGWAKADSVFIVDEDSEYKAYPLDVRNRKFELGAVVIYADNTTKTYKKSFDYMNTEWQFVAVPILLDITKQITSIECYIDYSNNNSQNKVIYYTDLRLCESQYSVNKYEGDLLEKSYSSDSKLGRKYIYNEDEQLVKVYYVDKNLLIPEDTTNVTSKIYDTYEYNINGKLWRTTDYNDIVTEKIFDNNGIEIKSLTYHKDNPAEIFYSEQKIDEKGNVIADYNALGDEVNNYTYDTKSGNVISSKDKNNIETSYGYSTDRSTLLQTTTNINGLNNTITYGYTLDFLTRLSHNDFDIIYDYDNQGRTTKISVGGSEYATMEYSDMVTKTKFKQDGKDKTIETILDKDGNVSSINYTSLKYNPENMEENEHEEKNLITNVYDTHGQLIGSSDGLTGEEIDYWYDEKCNLTKIQKDDKNFKTCITTTNNEDSSNTHIVIDEYVTEVTNTDGYATEVTSSGLSDINYTYTYDTTGVDKNLESIQIKDKDDNVLSYQTIKLDKLGRTKETTNGNYTKQYSYLTKGNHTSNLVSAEWFGKDNVIRENIHYTYDEKGNITHIKENGELVARYTYDALSRLIREDNAKFNKTTTISYDAGGNILNKSEYNYTLNPIIQSESSQSYNYEYSSNGWKDQLMSYNGETFRYDELGNPTTYRGKELTWDYGRSLVVCGNYSYKYNANGIRVSKTRKIENGLESTTTFFTNGTQILGQYDGNLMLFYYGVDGITGFKYEDNQYEYKKNILGDIIGIYDQNGTQICKYIYDAWGKCRTYVLKENNYVDISDKSWYTEDSDIYEMMAILNPFRYRGYYFDIETGLYYLNSRYYDPETGRFINADDVSCLDTDNINGLNLYMYCANNPINNVDTTGYAWWKKAWKKAVKAFVIVATVAAIVAITAVTAGAGTVLGGFIITGTIAAGANLFTQSVIQDRSIGQIDWLDIGVSFFAAAISSLVPGTGFTSILKQSFISAFVTEVGDAFINNRRASLGNVIKGTTFNMIFAYAGKFVSTKLKALALKVTLKSELSSIQNALSSHSLKGIENALNNALATLQLSTAVFISMGNFILEIIQNGI